MQIALIGLLIMALSLQTVQIRFVIARRKMADAKTCGSDLDMQVALKQTMWAWQVNTWRFVSLVILVVCLQILA